MIFSAVALMAFSVSGMANEVKGEVKQPENKKVIASVDCDKLANDTMDVYEAAGWSAEEAYEKGLEVYNVCIGKIKKVSVA